MLRAAETWPFTVAPTTKTTVVQACWLPIRQTSLQSSSAKAMELGESSGTAFPTWKNRIRNNCRMSSGCSQADFAQLKITRSRTYLIAPLLGQTVGPNDRDGDLSLVIDIVYLECPAVWVTSGLPTNRKHLRDSFQVNRFSGVRQVKNVTGSHNRRRHEW
jgi:hypothetical protein